MISGVIAGGRPYAAAGGGGGPTTIGEAFGGGYYIGDIVIGSDTYAIIMAGLSGESTQKWKSGATGTSGTSSLYDGAANTASMMSDTTAHAAAVYCDSYVSGVYADWYLPAKNELYLAWASLSSLAALSLGVSDYYWSSTQYASGSAWRQYFSSGLQDWSNKANSFKVRPVRRIIL